MFVKIDIIAVFKKKSGKFGVPDQTCGTSVKSSLKPIRKPGLTGEKSRDKLNS